MKLSICKVSIAYIMVLCGGVLYLSSMIIVKVDSNFDYRWAVFWLHIFSCLFIFISYLLLTSARSIKKLFSKKDVYLLLFISIITYLSNFTLLSIYPFVSISDELRDGGLFAMKIASGIVKNIFGYGSYGAHGLIIPTFIIPFYYIFSNSTLTYRLPAALLSSIDVLLLYILLTRVVNRQAAFWSSIVLATLPLHMFFAHTQVVVAFNFFWVPILLLILFNLFKNNRVIDYIFFGTVLGFVFEFHAAIRSFSLLICLFVILFLVKKILFDNARFLQKVKTSINKLFFLVLFTFVGFGPMLLFTTPQDFFHASRLISISPSMHSLLAIKNNYITSLLVYFYEPTSFFYADHKPIFSPILSIFFFAGLIYSFFVLKNYFLNILISLLILLPFLNSAITDSINADHRVSPLLLIASVFVGIGISFCAKLLKNNNIKFAFCALTVIYLLWQLVAFYFYQPANKNFLFTDYMSTKLFYFLQNDKEYQSPTDIYLRDMNSLYLPNSVCLYVSTNNYLYFNGNIKTEEQSQYLLPSVNVQFMKINSLADNEVYISKGGCIKNNFSMVVNSSYETSCSSENIFTCPFFFNKNFYIYY